MRFPSTIILFLLVLIAQALIAPRGIADTAREVIETTASQVIDRLNLEREKREIYPNQIYELIDELVLPTFDFNYISRLVLGGAYANATSEQRAAFQEQFKTLLVWTYASTLKEYSNNEIIYHPEETTRNPRLVVVKTEVLDTVHQSSLQIDYRMYNVNEEWKVVDVAINGVSLVTTYRGSFISEIRKNGIDALIAKLIIRNEKINETK